MGVARVGNYHKILVLDEARPFSPFFHSSIPLLLSIQHSFHEMFGALGVAIVREPEIASCQCINSSDVSNWSYYLKWDWEVLNCSHYFFACSYAVLLKVVWWLEYWKLFFLFLFFV